MDVFAKDENAFNTWLAQHSDAVTVLRSEEHPETDPPWNWVSFAVSAPVPWEGPGLPTISKGEVNSADTADRPDPPPTIEEQLDQAGEAVKEAGEAVKSGLVVAGIGLAGYLLYKLLG